ncbi:MAG: hypothetical protein ACJ74F_32260 [Mycobacterium sp.]|uniref:hypothetical protein n=1 Tax=Mycobacterium sp. TaxID=1785 RepID=UPI003899F7E1
MADWNPGRTHWWATTAIAIIGAIVGGTSLIMNFFYHPSPPPITIDSSHSEFMKLSYSDRVDRCVPHIEQHFDEWRDKWRTALTDAGTSHSKPPISYAPLDDPEATGQAIVNSQLAVVNYAEKLAPTDEGENLLSCVYSPAPKSDNIVVHESAVYTQGAFAGVTAEGRANKIVEVVIRPGQDETHRELGFVMASGHDQGVGMWALMASGDAGEPDWMNGIENYKGD